MYIIDVGQTTNQPNRSRKMIGIEFHNRPENEWAAVCANGKPMLFASIEEAGNFLAIRNLPKIVNNVRFFKAGV
jgi:hypothetical protein